MPRSYRARRNSCRYQLAHLTQRWHCLRFTTGPILTLAYGNSSGWHRVSWCLPSMPPFMTDSGCLRSTCPRQQHRCRNGHPHRKTSASGLEGHASKWSRYRHSVEMDLPRHTGSGPMHTWTQRCATVARLSRSCLNPWWMNGWADWPLIWRVVAGSPAYSGLLTPLVRRRTSARCIRLIRGLQTSLTARSRRWHPVVVRRLTEDLGCPVDGSCGSIVKAERDSCLI